MKDEGLDLLAAWWENGIRYRRDYIEAPSYKCLECGRSEYSKREIEHAACCLTGITFQYLIDHGVKL